jgi:hypothetical protein
MDLKSKLPADSKLLQQTAATPKNRVSGPAGEQKAFCHLLAALKKADTVVEGNTDHLQASGYPYT